MMITKNYRSKLLISDYIGEINAPLFLSLLCDNNDKVVFPLYIYIYYLLLLLFLPLYFDFKIDRKDININNQ
jgi:hypothetical protein